jgi:hypothetical protein
MENRHGLFVDGMATTADGHAERDASLLLLHRHGRAGRARTVGADKRYDTPISSISRNSSGTRRLSVRT